MIGSTDEGSSQPQPEQRRAARVIVRDVRGRLLLFCGTDPHNPGLTYWFTPGGGIDATETLEEAAARELQEEVGLTATDLLPIVREDEVEFGFEGVTYRQRQGYFAVEIPCGGDEVEIDREGWTDYERRSVIRHHWWSVEELAGTSESVYPADLADLVASIQRWGTAARL